MTLQWQEVPNVDIRTANARSHKYAPLHSRACGLAPRQEGVRCSRASSNALQTLREAAILLAMTLGGGFGCVWLWNLRMGVR